MAWANVWKQLLRALFLILFSCAVLILVQVYNRGKAAVPGQPDPAFDHGLVLVLLSIFVPWAALAIFAAFQRKLGIGLLIGTFCLTTVSWLVATLLLYGTVLSPINRYGSTYPILESVLPMFGGAAAYAAVTVIQLLGWNPVKPRLEKRRLLLNSTAASAIIGVIAIWSITALGLFEPPATMLGPAMIAPEAIMVACIIGYNLWRQHP